MLQNPYTGLDDAAVHQSLLALAKLERDTGVAIILHLLLVKERKLYAAWGHDSVFSYCTERLGFSRSTAYRRKVVVETVTAFPSLLSRLTDGRLQLCAAAAVAPHLTTQNAEELLEAVQRLSHREVEAYLVKRRARREVEPAKGPAAAQSPLGLFGTEAETSATLSDTAAEKPLPLPRTTIKPLTVEASRVHVTLTEPTLALLARAKELLAGRPDDEVLGRALTALLERLAPERRHARRESARENLAVKAPRSAAPSATAASRTAPTLEPSRRGRLADRDAAAVDGGGQCSYVGPDCHRCTARGFLQTDHVIPWSKGGPSQRWNFAPLCATHNAFKGAKLSLGPALSPRLGTEAKSEAMAEAPH